MLMPVTQELTVDELNQLTVEPVDVEMDELVIRKLTLPEHHAKLKEILKIEHLELTNKQWEAALDWTASLWIQVNWDAQKEFKWKLTQAT